MKATKIFKTYWQALFASIFILSFLQVSPVYAAPGVDFSIDKFNIGSFNQGDQGKTYTILVDNLGDDPSSGTVTVTDTPGAGLTVTAISGTGWSCTLGTLTCTRSDSLSSGGQYPAITVTVNVAVDAPTTVSNTAQVSYVGDTDPPNNQDTDSTAVTQMPDLIITNYEFRNMSNQVITQVAANQEFYVRFYIKNQGGEQTGLFYSGVFLDQKPNYGPDHSDPPLVLGEITDFQDYKIAPEGTEGFPQGGCLYYDPNDTVDPFNTLVTEVMPERGNYTKQDFNSALPAGDEVTIDIYISYPDVPPFTGSEYDNIRTGLPAGTYDIYLYVDPNCSGGDRESNENNNSYGPIPLTVTGSSPCTIPTGNPPVFGDVPNGYWAKAEIEAMYYCGYTGGCSTTPLLFCPEKIMSRAESAVFLLRGSLGTSYTPPAPPWNTFQDSFSPGPWAQGWVQGLYNAGMTAGCSTNPMLYCPWQETTRAELAVFALRLKYGTSYFPPPATGTVFADITDPNFWAARWAERAYIDGLIASCGTQGSLPMFCPTSLVSRALASVSIVKAKGLLP